MSTHIMSASEFRTKMAEVITAIEKDVSPCFVTRNGRAVAALLPIGLYDELISALEDRLDEEDASLAAEVHEARKEYRAGKSVPMAKLKRLLGH